MTNKSHTNNKARLYSDTYFPSVFSGYWISLNLYLMNMSQIAHILWVITIMLNSVLLLGIFRLRITYLRITKSEQLSIVLLLLFSTLSFLYGNFKWALQISRISWDATWFVMTISGVFFVFMSRKGIERFFWANISLAILSIVQTFPKLDLDLLLLGRDATYSQEIQSGIHWSAAFQVPEVLFFIYLVINTLFIRNRKITLILFTLLVVYLVFTLFFGKRAGFTALGTSGLLLLVFAAHQFFIKGSIKKVVVNSVIFTVFIFAIVIFVLSRFDWGSTLINNVLLRFTDTLNSFDKYDRLLETTFFFNQLDILDWIFGKGIGVKASLNSILFKSPLHLHVGFADVIYHGGLLLLLTLLIPLISYSVEIFYYGKGNQFQKERSKFSSLGDLFRFFYIFFFLFGSITYLSPTTGMFPSILTGLYIFNCSITSNFVQILKITSNENTKILGQKLKKRSILAGN